MIYSFTHGSICFDIAVIISDRPMLKTFTFTSKMVYSEKTYMQLP